MSGYIPDSRAEYVRIDDEYTYSFDEGRVGLLKNGHWTGLANGKAWIAAANEITDLRRKLAESELHRLQAEFEHIAELEEG